MTVRAFPQEISFEGSALTESYLALACERSAVVARTVRGAGGLSLSAYVQSLLQSGPSGDEDRSSFLDAVRDYTASLLGAKLAARVRAELAEIPSVLTTNHHGVDSFAQSVQGSLLFSRRRDRTGRRPSTVPVFACGAVPLDNLTYPMGLLLYHAADGELDRSPRRLPLFSNRHRRALVSAAPPIDEQMVDRARARLGKLAAAGEIDGAVAEAIERVLVEDYRCAAVLNLGSYSEQAVVLNHRIWRRLFARPDEQPALVYLELEKIVVRLLEADLADSRSLASRALFDPVLRGELLRRLDGMTGCWKEALLAERLHDPKAVPHGCGTAFFWGVNERSRRVPLAVHEGMLRGVDDAGRPFEHRFTPADVIAGLRDADLLPSLFTCFLSIAFDRGIECLGGYHQAAYLPDMQRRLVAALGCSDEYRPFAERVRARRTGGYLAGMQAVMRRVGGGALIPAGIGEIIASGGLSDERLRQLDAVTVHEAHLASLFETVAELATAAPPEAGWKAALAADYAQALDRRVVVV